MSEPTENWTKVSLSELCENIQYGYTASAKEEPIGPRFLRITDIVPEIVDWSSVPFCEIDEKRVDRYLLKEGDIVIARTGATTGYAKYIRKSPKAVFASYLVRIQLKNDVDSRYVGLVVESQDYKRYIQQIVGGAAQPNANAKVLTSYSLPLPPLNQQRKIADFLFLYKDTIENNNQRMQILEQIARTIYEEWFINYRYPGHENREMMESELRLIPEGWEVLEVGTLLTKTRSRGKIKKSEYHEKGRFPIIDQGASEIAGYTDDDSLVHQKPLPLIVFGDHTRVLKFVSFPFVRGADGTQILCPDDSRVTPIYFYHALRQIDLPSFGYARHFKFLKAKKIVVPPKEILMEFESMTSDLYGEIKILMRKSSILQESEDLLVPKLVTGEIDVSELDIEPEEEPS